MQGESKGFSIVKTNPAPEETKGLSTTNPTSFLEESKTSPSLGESKGLSISKVATSAASETTDKSGSKNAEQVNFSSLYLPNILIIPSCPQNVNNFEQVVFSLKDFMEKTKAREEEEKVDDDVEDVEMEGDEEVQEKKSAESSEDESVIDDEESMMMQEDEEEEEEEEEENNQQIATPSSSICKEILSQLNLMGRIFCKQCRKGFKAEQSLRRHMKTEHTGLKFVCSKCEKHFTQKSKMERHSLTHGNAMKWVCQELEVDFNEENGRYLHCKFQFTRSEGLKRHKRVIHEAGDRYQCEVCSKNFSQKHSLKTHSLIHAGIKPHKCNHCDKSFTQKNQLAKHQKSAKNCEEESVIRNARKAMKLVKPVEVRLKPVQIRVKLVQIRVTKIKITAKPVGRKSESFMSKFIEFIEDKEDINDELKGVDLW